MVLVSSSNSKCIFSWKFTRFLSIFPTGRLADYCKPRRRSKPKVYMKLARVCSTPFKFKTSAAVRSEFCLKFKGTCLRVEKNILRIFGPMEVLIVILNLPSHNVLLAVLILSYNQCTLVAAPLPRGTSSTLSAPVPGDFLMIISSDLCSWAPVMPEWAPLMLALIYSISKSVWLEKPRSLLNPVEKRSKQLLLNMSYALPLMMMMVLQMCYFYYMHSSLIYYISHFNFNLTECCN